MEFTISNRAKNFSYALIGIGLAGTLIGFFMDHSDHHQKFWSNLLVNGFFFFGVSLIGLFMLALQFATESGWAVVTQRVYEAVMAYIPVGAVVLLIVFAASSLHVNHLYHWMDPEVMAHDELIAGKAAYLNQPFFWVRTLVYLATFILFARSFRKRSLLHDQVGGTELHYKSYRQGALFLVFFAVFSSTMSWDWLMSIDTHWFSTLYGWYVFSGMWISGIIVVLMLVFYLQGQGYLKDVNESHIHDLGKWVFAISFLWSYLWFFQFMLIWYSNIPEEVTYFQFRIEHYKTEFFLMFAINFVLPMLFLMSRESKRHRKLLTLIALVVFFGHWYDMYLLVMPGTMFEEQHYGIMELGMFLLFAGIFIMVVLKALTKAPLTPANHPYLDESIHHHI